MCLQDAKHVEAGVAIAIDELVAGWTPVQPSDLLDGVHARMMLALGVDFAGEMLVDQASLCESGAGGVDALAWGTELTSAVGGEGCSAVSHDRGRATGY